MAIVLASRLESVYLWVSGPDLARRMQATRENDVYLPGLLVPPTVEITTDLAAALADADIVLCVVPSHFARGLWQRALPHLDRKASIFVSATKGLEAGTHMRMSEALAEGLGLGNNAMAALITRGLAEITRLAVAMGAKPKTLAGLAGLGDLVLTCTGDLSRNRRVGIELARGRSLAEITASIPMIAEGV